MKKESPGCLFIMMSLTMLPISVAISAWTLTILWRWFAVPIFGMRPLSMGAAIGLSALVSAFRQVDATQKSDKSLQEITTDLAVLVAFKTGMLLLLGWIAKSFM